MDSLEDRLLTLFGQSGFSRTEPAILQPTDVFLDVSGEDIRRRLFVTADDDGREWCLRPEYTIPVCRAHLAARAMLPADYAYAGPVFRRRSGESGEFRQAGLESIGRDDREAADSDVLTLACKALDLAGITAPQIVLGDVAILQALLRGLNLPAAAERRFMRALARGDGDRALAALDPADQAASRDHAGLLAAVQGQAPDAARAFVTDVLSIAGISTVGGRSAADIAERFLMRASERDQIPSGEARAVLARALAIDTDPDGAALALRALATEAGLDLGSELDAFEMRTGFMAAQGLDVTRMRFRTGFVRNLEYYTSFIFELRAPDAGLAAEAASRPLAGGGRYDHLMSRLGAPTPLPAVGVSIWLDRMPPGTTAEAPRS